MSQRSPARWAAADTPAPPASRPTSAYEELVEFLGDEARRRARLSRATPSRRRICSSTSRPGSPPTTSSPGYRRELGGPKVGHAGTLDPFATGLLIILLGRATRLQRYLLGLPKTYVATARLGWRSTTGDPDGELTETGECRAPRAADRPDHAEVPMTSAVKVDGERLYKKAHRGEDVERPEREVEIHRADLLEDGRRSRAFEVECSSGTYIRTLIETLGDAYCEELRRTAIGHAARPGDARSGGRSRSRQRRWSVFCPRRCSTRRRRTGSPRTAPDPRRPVRRCAPPRGLIAISSVRDGRLSRDAVARLRTACCATAIVASRDRLGSSRPMSIKVTQLPDAEPRARATSRSAPSTASTSATAR